MADQATIRLAIPYTDEDEITEIRAVLESGYLTQGPKVAEFERMIADYVGAKHAFATSSATTALHLSLAALGIGTGDEVLIPDFTFPATANVVVQQGARPVLVDVNLDTFTINLDDMRAKITPRTKAVMPVHAFGLAADMKPLMDIAAQHNIAVIEDAACAIGTTYYGQQVGAIGTLGCYSFHPRKVITTGEGGMIVTNDPALAERIALLRSHGGIRRDGRFTFEAAGYNYRLSDVLGAMGVAQMRKLDTLIARKREMASQLTALIQDIPGVKPTREPAWGGHIFQSYVTLLDEGINRDQVIAGMRAQGIETTIGTYSLHAEPFFMQTFGYAAGDLPCSYQAYRQALTLPLYPQMSEADLERVAGALRQVVGEQA
jgi:perosamine synthetase